MIKRSSMVLFSESTGLYSHQVRIALAEKAVTSDVVPVDLAQPPEDLQELNPELILPTLVDRDLVLTDATIIMEYLDERFPHPPLLPIYPVAKAKARLLMRRIDSDWYGLAKRLEADRQDAEARADLAQRLERVVVLFGNMPFFMSEEFSMVDCVLAPLVWRLPYYGIDLTGDMQPIEDYGQRMFERLSFQASLSIEEVEMREDDDYDF